MYSEVRKTVTDVLGFFWQQVFLDPAFVSGQTMALSLNFDALNALADSLPDYLSRKKIPYGDRHVYRLFVFNEADLDRDAAHYGDPGVVYGGGIAYGQQITDFTQWKYPIDSGLLPEFLTTGFTTPGIILRRDTDYVVADGSIIFFRNPLEIPGIMKRVTSYQGQTPVFSFLFWGFQVMEDIGAVCDYFGTVAGVCGPGTAVMQEAVNIAWDLRVEDATVRNVKRMLSVLTRTEYARQAGTVREIRPEGDSICIRTDVDVYTAPVTAIVLVDVGDALVSGQLLFDSFAVHEGVGEIEFSDFEGVALAPGFIQDVKAPLFFVNQIVPVEKTHDPDWVTVQAE